ncbi:hypothetical protein [Prauserella endophytica]|uniref:Uncharacterized protein n=1 Tax=Prauserella endophytica TaxID=1592324 RepID=A0ABY2RYX1_9PSEU|nr:hypothetical protein [Prauserella endophytica]TKG66189.1 hypothetical protein FCN18_25450 [Prauserella endophytica]
MTHTEGNAFVSCSHCQVPVEIYPPDDGHDVTVTCGRCAGTACAVIDATPEGVAEVGRFVVVGESERHVRDLIGGDTAQRDDETGNDCADWLHEFLSAGPVKSAEVYKAADAAGFSKDQAKRAKKKLGVIATHPDIKGPWFWEVPADDEPQGSTQGSKGADSHAPAPLHPLSAPLDDECIQCHRNAPHRNPNTWLCAACESEEHVA